MSCPHTETTAVLAAFGEAPADFPDHLAVCSACRAVVDAHTETLAALGVEPAATPRGGWRPWHSAVLLAAAVLLAVQVFSPGADPLQRTIDSPVPETREIVLASQSFSFETTLDSDLSDLELELALMSLE